MLPINLAYVSDTNRHGAETAPPGKRVIEIDSLNVLSAHWKWGANVIVSIASRIAASWNQHFSPVRDCGPRVIDDHCVDRLIHLIVRGIFWIQLNICRELIDVRFVLRQEMFLRNFSCNL